MQRRYLNYDQFTTRAFGKVPYMREITVVAFAGRSSPRRDRYIGSERVLSIAFFFFFVHGDSGVTKSRTTSASSVALARTSRAVMARALPSCMARSCLCGGAISLGNPLGKWTVECLTTVRSSRLLQSQKCEVHHPHPRSGSKSWCASSGEHARRFPDLY